MTEAEGDLPKIVAAITVALPSMAFKTGFAYLRMRRKAHRMSRIIERDLVANGIPRDAAHKLAESVRDELSIRTLMGRFGATFLKR